MQRDAEINIKVKLNKDNFPEQIKWDATEANFDGLKEAQAMFLSFWDKDEKATLSIDLWTDEMLVDDMNAHYFQVFLKMADTYYNSSKNAEVAEFIKQFAVSFGQKMNLNIKG